MTAYDLHRMVMVLVPVECIWMPPQSMKGIYGPIQSDSMLNFTDVIK